MVPFFRFDSIHSYRRKQKKGVTFSPRKILLKCDTIDKTSLHKDILSSRSKRFSEKKEVLPGSLKTMCDQLFLKQLQMMSKRTFTKFIFLSNRICSFCETFQKLLAFWIFLYKIKSFPFRILFNAKWNLSTFQFQVGPTYYRKMMAFYLA